MHKVSALTRLVVIAYKYTTYVYHIWHAKLEYTNGNIFCLVRHFMPLYMCTQSSIDMFKKTLG